MERPGLAHWFLLYFNCRYTFWTNLCSSDYHHHHSHRHNRNIIFVIINNLNVSVLNYAPRQADVWGTRGKAPRILNLGTVWRWVTTFTFRPLSHTGKSPRHQMDKKLGGPQTLCGLGGRESNPSPAPYRSVTELKTKKEKKWKNRWCWQKGNKWK